MWLEVVLTALGKLCHPQGFSWLATQIGSTREFDGVVGSGYGRDQSGIPNGRCTKMLRDAGAKVLLLPSAIMQGERYR